MKVSFGGILALIFITLKLTGTITWSWVWVLAPLWSGIVLAVAFLAVGGIAALTLLILEKYTK